MCPSIECVGWGKLIDAFGYDGFNLFTDAFSFAGRSFRKGISEFKFHFCTYDRLIGRIRAFVAIFEKVVVVYHRVTAGSATERQP